jgi:hypothetical protein
VSHFIENYKIAIKEFIFNHHNNSGIVVVPAAAWANENSQAKI